MEVNTRRNSAWIVARISLICHYCIVKSVGNASFSVVFFTDKVIIVSRCICVQTIQCDAKKIFGCGLRESVRRIKT